jgi:hypothetical protein
MRKLTAAATLLAAFAACPAPAQASIILALDGSPKAVAGGFDYTYDATLSVDQQLNTSTGIANFFTLYDFGATSLVGTTGNLSNGWSFATDLNETSPAQAENPNNNPLIDDVRATYTGAGIITGASLGGGVGDLGTFTLFTTANGPAVIKLNDQDAQLLKYAPGEPTNDTVVSNIAAVALPSSLSVPEPASVVLLGVGLGALAFTRRRAGAAV